MCLMRRLARRWRARGKSFTTKEVRYDIRRNNCRRAMRRFAHGDVAGAQGLPRLAPRPGEFSERYAIHTLYSPARRGAAQMLGAVGAGDRLELSADSHTLARRRVPDLGGVEIADGRGAGRLFATAARARPNFGGRRGRGGRGVAGRLSGAGTAVGRRAGRRDSRPDAGRREGGRAGANSDRGGWNAVVHSALRPGSDL